MVYYEPMEYLQNASYMDAISKVYTNAGLGSWWIIILFVFTLIMVGLGTRDEGVVGWVTLVGSALLISYGELPVAIHPVLYFFAVFGLAIGLWKTFSKGD